MNGIVGLVAFCVLCACFAAACVTVYMWARGVDAKLELLDWRSSRARRRIEEVDDLAWRALSVVRGLEKRVKELEAEVADHRAFLNFIEDYMIEADATGIQEVPSGCDCCNPELD